jgi:hypothetical protein
MDRKQLSPAWRLSRLDLGLQPPGFDLVELEIIDLTVGSGRECMGCRMGDWVLQAVDTEQKKKK